MCSAITITFSKPVRRMNPARSGAMDIVERREGLGGMTGGLQMRYPGGPRNTGAMPCSLPSARSIGGRRSC
ncbi:MAG: hypothetical protein JWO02_3812 [Solirubrobacterales bacterium]|nr:hypothetical protein [Solirubrobacterales bacterium]